MIWGYDPGDMLTRELRRWESGDTHQVRISTFPDASLCLDGDWADPCGNAITSDSS